MTAPAHSDLPVAIICGGKGTRLGGLTANTPKSLVDVNGRPFIHWQLDLLKKQGFSRFVLCCGHLASDFLGKMDGYDVTYSLDGPTPLGTGGAVKNALPLLGDSFFVTYGDSYLRADPAQIFAHFLARNKNCCLGRWCWTDYGMNVFKREAFDVSEGAFDMHTVFQLNKKMRQLTCFKMNERFYEIGSPEGLEEVRNLLK